MVLLLPVFLPAPFASPSRPSHANCALVAAALPSLQDLAVARPAVRAFAHQLGRPYTILCLKIAANRAAAATGVLLVQRSATHFTRYTYQAQHLDSLQLVAASWQTLAARLGAGHYATQCESISTAPTNYLVLVKQGAKLRYSLQFTTYYASDFTPADQVRLAPALALVHRLLP